MYICSFKADTSAEGTDTQNIPPTVQVQIPLSVAAKVLAQRHQAQQPEIDAASRDVLHGKCISDCKCDTSENKH